MHFSGKQQKPNPYITLKYCRVYEYTRVSTQVRLVIDPRHKGRGGI